MAHSRIRHMPHDRVKIGEKVIKPHYYLRSKEETHDNDVGEDVKNEIAESRRAAKKAGPHEKGKHGEVKAKRKKATRKEYHSTGPHFGQKAVGGEKVAKYRRVAHNEVKAEHPSLSNRKKRIMPNRQAANKAYGEVSAKHPSKSPRKLGLTNIEYRKVASKINAKGIPAVPQHGNMMRKMLAEYRKQRR